MNYSAFMYYFISLDNNIYISYYIQTKNFRGEINEKRSTLYSNEPRWLYR